MKGMIRGLILVLGVALSLDTLARDPGQRSAFVKHHPCPSTGKARGACPGYVVDHIKPLCAGDASTSCNLPPSEQEAIMRIVGACRSRKGTYATLGGPRCVEPARS